MKKILPSLLPALALLTLGGCAGTSGLSTTENDGVYYSSQDRTTAVASAVASTSAPAAPESQDISSGDVENPDYTGPTSSRGSASAEYYDDDYYYASRLRRFHQTPYRGMGLGYYDFAYTDPFWYGGRGYYPYSAWGPGAFYDPWYGGSFANINIGFGRPWYRPYGGYGYGYSPFDYGYGYGGFGRPWGGYGYGYGYGNGFYNNAVGGWGGYYDRPGRRATYGGRRDRSTDVSGVTAPNGGGTSTTGRSRVQEGGFTTPSTSTTNGIVAQPGTGTSRRRVQEVPVTGLPDSNPNAPAETRTRVRGNEPAPTTQSSGSVAEQPAGRRWRVLESTTGNSTTAPSGQPAGTATEPAQRRRSYWSDDNGSRQASQPSPAEQPRRQSRFSESSEPTRTYSQPSRTYSEPSRSYSEPSRGSSFGGGNSGGGGGRRGRVQ